VHISTDVQPYIKLASAQLPSAVFPSVFFSTVTFQHIQKVAVYNAVCVSILLYGCETSVLCRRHITALEAFHIRCLQGILGLRWWHKVTHLEILRRTSSNSTEYMILQQRQLRWIGHVIRMTSNRLPRRVLYAEILRGSRSRGGPKKRFSDHVKVTLKKCHIPAEQLETLAADRGPRGAASADGLDSYMSEFNQAADDRHMHRHANSTTSPSIVHAITSATECVLPTLVSEAISVVTSNSTASSSISTDNFKEGISDGVNYTTTY